MSLMPPSQISFSPAFSPDHDLTGRGIELAGSATFDPSLKNRPGDIVTKKMVATTFRVALEDLQQSQPMASWCSYKMIENGKTLNVDVSIRIFDTDEAAAEDFFDSTRSVTASEMAKARKAIREKAGNSAKLDASAAQNTFTNGVSAMQQRGIQFEDVKGIADQARFETTEGTLRLQQANLRMTLSAFYGPDMTIPDVVTAETLIKAVNTWQQNTMRLRRKQTIALAKAVLAAL